MGGSVRGSGTFRLRDNCSRGDLKLHRPFFATIEKSEI